MPCKNRMMKHTNSITGFILLALVAALARLIPHIPNFTPVESLTLFSTAYILRKRWAFVLSVTLLYISDFIINNTVARSFFPDHEGMVWFSQYMIFTVVAMAMIVLVSSKFLRKINVGNVILSVLIASVIFFIVTNFGSWVGEKSIYTRDLNGLMTSFAAGLPFFRSSLISNLLFSAILFGGFEMYQYFASGQKRITEV